ncbi:MAG TPA: hypothetical protein DD729_03445 [Rhodobacteraceae bacterium]|jgi:uncharacterized phage protein (TIGR02218 family)|nr:hypothetical protein [Paracoccaceae bacterium]
MGLSAEFEAHLRSGITTVCRCWSLVRCDGASYGFTDHDGALEFEGMVFKADTGMTAKALQQTSGLAVDNSEALGALSDASITEADIAAGRFDGAVVKAWLVNWADLDQRVLQFRGTIGELQRSGGAFQAELRGLSEALNQPQGRVYQRQDTSVLEDGSFGFDLDVPGYRAQIAVEEVEDARIFRFADLAGFEPRWFERGKFEVLSGAAQGLVGVVKNDRLSNEGREIELWESIRAPIKTGDMLRISAGYDQRPETSRLKFHNYINYRGFPFIPGEDWLMSVPKRGGVNDGGSLNQ